MHTALKRESIYTINGNVSFVLVSQAIYTWTDFPPIPNPSSVLIRIFYFTLLRSQLLYDFSTVVHISRSYVIATLNRVILWFPHTKLRNYCPQALRRSICAFGKVRIECRVKSENVENKSEWTRVHSFESISSMKCFITCTSPIKTQGKVRTTFDVIVLAEGRNMQRDMVTQTLFSMTTTCLITQNLSRKH